MGKLLNPTLVSYDSVEMVTERTFEIPFVFNKAAFLEIFSDNDKVTLLHFLAGEGIESLGRTEFKNGSKSFSVV